MNQGAAFRIHTFRRPVGLWKNVFSLLQVSTGEPHFAPCGATLGVNEKAGFRTHL